MQVPGGFKTSFENSPYDSFADEQNFGSNDYRDTMLVSSPLDPLIVLYWIPKQLSFQVALQILTLVYK